MTRYQAYFVESDGYFAHCRAFTCDTDEHAIEWAKQLIAGRPVELWSGARAVKRLSCPHDSNTLHALPEGT
jgi:hypothetical protein